MRPNLPHRPARKRALDAVTVLLLWIAPVTAQESACSAQALGRVACIDGKLCTCRFTRGSPATGLSEGFGWDCGILRPSCGEPAPATLDPWPNQLPDALAIDRSRTIISNRPPKPYGWPRH